MGMPKGMLELGGRPIVKYLLSRFAWPGPTLLVTAPGREHPPGAARFDREVPDPEAGLGPLRGVLTALEHLHTPLLLVTAVDMPGIGRGQLEWYVRAIADHPDADGLMATRPAETGPLLEPLPCILRPRAGELVAARLSSGRRSLHGLASGPRFVTVPAPAWPAGVWWNVNRPEDLGGPPHANPL